MRTQLLFIFWEGSAHQLAEHRVRILSILSGDDGLVHRLAIRAGFRGVILLVTLLSH
jgi:hypothetical protein